jgi:hypothetical protein
MMPMPASCAPFIPAHASAGMSASSAPDASLKSAADTAASVVALS